MPHRGLALPESRYPGDKSQSPFAEMRGAVMNRNECKDLFLRGYLDAALFTTDETPPSGCDYVEAGRSDEMFPRLPEYFIEKAKADCARFEKENAALLEKAGDYWQNGADFWYTRNGHGVGFLDRGYPDDIAEPLTDAAHKFGEHDLCPEDIGQPDQDIEPARLPRAMKHQD
jgi:hypothetical protein